MMSNSRIDDINREVSNHYRDIAIMEEKARSSDTMRNRVKRVAESVHMYEKWKRGEITDRQAEEFLSTGRFDYTEIGKYDNR